MAFFLETLLGGLMAGMLYSLVALGFGALVLDAARRHAAAKRLLAELDPRGDRP